MEFIPLVTKMNGYCGPGTVAGPSQTVKLTVFTLFYTVLHDFNTISSTIRTPYVTCGLVDGLIRGTVGQPSVK